jgi:hypothetical protein
MSIKNIYTIFSGSESDQKISSISSYFAEKLSSYLNFVYPVAECVNNLSITGKSSSLAKKLSEDMQLEYNAEQEQKIKTLENLLKEQNLFDSSNFICENGNVNSTISYYSTFADLMILAIEASERNDNNYMDLIKSAIFETSCPKLLIPSTSELKKFPEKVMLAWDGTSDSAKAIKNSTAILKNAKNILILSINEADKDISSIIEIKSYLDSHNIKSEFLGVKHPNFCVGNTILEEASKINADLLVMGAYSHYKSMDNKLGGATKYILNNANIPIFIQN